MKKSEVKQLIREEIIKSLHEGTNPTRSAWILSGNCLNWMRRIKSIIPGKEELYIERMLPVFKEMKKFLSTAQLDHPSLKKSYEYVFEIVEELESSSKVAALQALGGGVVIKEFLEIVDKPLKKVVHRYRLG